MLKISWKRGKIAPEEQFLSLSTIFYYLMLDFYFKTGIRFSLRDKRLFEITEVEITRVDCISLIHRTERAIINSEETSCGFEAGNREQIRHIRQTKISKSVHDMHLCNTTHACLHRLQRNCIFKLAQNEPNDPKGPENICCAL